MNEMKNAAEIEIAQMKLTAQETCRKLLEDSRAEAHAVESKASARANQVVEESSKKPKKFLPMRRRRRRR